MVRNTNEISVSVDSPIGDDEPNSILKCQRFYTYAKRYEKKVFFCHHFVVFQVFLYETGTWQSLKFKPSLMCLLSDKCNSVVLEKMAYADRRCR